MAIRHGDWGGGTGVGVTSIMGGGEGHWSGDHVHNKTWYKCAAGEYFSGLRNISIGHLF